MATQSAVFAFALPEDENSDELLIKEASTKDGTYSTVATVTYEYGTTTHEFDSLDDTKWYKIQFNNSDDSETGPDSEPVYGGDFSKASPFLAISTTTDGANYASTDDVFEYSSLTTDDVTTSRVSQALRRARAIVDHRTAELDLERFTKTWGTSTSRKKYNATLRVIKEAEINIALGNVYRGLSDDLITDGMRDHLAGTNSSGSSVQVGNTSLSQQGGIGNTEHATYLAALAERYTFIGDTLLNSIQPKSIRIHYSEGPSARRKFKLPFNGVE